MVVLDLDKLNTVFQFRGRWNKVVLYISLWIYLSSIYTFLYTIAPTIIGILYLYPVHTMIRLPFILNSVLYINSVLAILISLSAQQRHPTYNHKKWRCLRDCNQILGALSNLSYQFYCLSQ